MTDPRDRGPRPGPAAEIGRYLGHGITWALSTLLFLAVGFWVDGKAGTAPLFTIMGAFVGAGAGFYNLYYHLVVEPRKRGRSDRGES
ncbi:MAG TPA: AtpZ/AtpI family protein [Longimicrobiales bacterium]|nr:AtpZ/AtpI family protein [Longimicrobiales bacterium]